MNAGDQDLDGPRIEEYRAIGQNMRFYPNLRFASLTVFLAFSSGLMLLSFDRIKGSSSMIRAVSKAGGLIVGVLFLIMELRHSAYWECFKTRALELEKILPFRQYTNLPKPWVKVVRARYAPRLLYLAVIIFWLAVMLFAR